MLFRRISYKIALQFTAFVFGLLLITGSIFIAADILNHDRMLRARMERQVLPILQRTVTFGTLPPLPPFQRERFRILNSLGRPLYSGNLYQDIPFEPTRDIIKATIGDETYDILTAVVSEDGQVVGYIQVAERSQSPDIFMRLLLFLVISGAISGLTFGVGLFFARRSLKPAEEMMNRLNQFTQDASHELRTPLTSVSTSLDLALATQQYPERIVEAKKDLKEITTLIERLLELARLDSFTLQKERIDFSSFIHDLIEKHRDFAKEKNSTVESSIAPDVTTYGDPALLRQVFSNIFMNAVKFNKPDGKISVMLTSKDLSIHDTGKGISAEALPHIFDRFYQEDTARTKGKEGLGLGLALSKRIVELHGWTLIAASKEGEGTTVTLHFGS